MSLTKKPERPNQPLYHCSHAPPCMPVPLPTMERRHHLFPHQERRWEYLKRWLRDITKLPCVPLKRSSRAETMHFIRNWRIPLKTLPTSCEIDPAIRK